MALLDDLGLGGVIGGGGLNVGSITSGLGAFSKFIIIAVLLSVLVGAWYYSKNFKKAYNKKIHIFEEINGELVPVDDDRAMLMTIPETTVKVFFLKKNKIYLPEGIIKVGKDRYFYAIRNNREWVNFRLTNINKEMEEAGLDYDHTDMRYANTQLKKLIEKSYKKTKWWQEYRNEISVAILILMLTFSFWFLFGEMRDLVSQITGLIKEAKEVQRISGEAFSNIANLCSPSGIVKV
jgi:hypothetical protein|tara:strand:- start:12927 stop:13634 length:708 start_codon:yes stop_codon:yes gene_type:complete